MPGKRLQIAMAVAIFLSFLCPARRWLAVHSLPVRGVGEFGMGTEDPSMLASAHFQSPTRFRSVNATPVNILSEFTWHLTFMMNPA
jgi:hypothetical protein